MNVPERPRDSIVPARFNACHASLTVAGLTPSLLARPRTVGSRSAVFNRPERTSLLTAAAIPLGELSVIAEASNSVICGSSSPGFGALVVDHTSKLFAAAWRLTMLGGLAIRLTSWVRERFSTIRKWIRRLCYAEHKDFCLPNPVTINRLDIC